MTAKIPDAADAVMVAPLLRVDDNDIRSLADHLIQKKLPSYSLLRSKRT